MTKKFHSKISSDEEFINKVELSEDADWIFASSECNIQIYCRRNGQAMKKVDIIKTPGAFGKIPLKITAACIDFENGLIWLSETNNCA